ncbi:membrane protein [soil metagenome]
MQACAIKFWAIILLAMAGITAQAQEVSPYSRYGMGDIQSPNFAAARSMGGLSAAYRDGYNINSANPASYSMLRFVTFETGLVASNRWLSTANSSYKAGDGFLDYVAMAFPFHNGKGTISTGLRPFSSMRYDLQGNYTDSSGSDYSRLYSGKGRTYDFYTGYGHNFVFKDTLGIDRHSLSLGINAAYRFGQLRYGEVLTLADDPNALSARRNATLRVSDVIITVGAQYRTCLNCGAVKDTSKHTKPLMLTLGVYGGTPTNMKSSLSSVFDRFYISGSNVITIDTITNTDDGKIKLNMPAQMGFGATLGDYSRWQIGFDIKYTMWNGFKGLNQTEALKNSLRVGGGLEFVPNDQGRGFVRRSRYRVGGYFDSGYLDINGQSISEYGMTFGVGVPMRPLNRGRDMLNIGLEAGSRGTTSNGLLQESFIRVSIGIVLNSATYDTWFQKRKYE